MPSRMCNQETMSLLPPCLRAECVSTVRPDAQRRVGQLLPTGASRSPLKETQYLILQRRAPLLSARSCVMCSVSRFPMMCRCPPRPLLVVVSLPEWVLFSTEQMFSVDKVQQSLVLEGWTQCHPGAACSGCNHNHRDRYCARKRINRPKIWSNPLY